MCGDIVTCMEDVTKTKSVPELLPCNSTATWSEVDHTAQRFLCSRGLTRLPVPGDGHCILNAVSLSLRRCGICSDDKSAIESRLKHEIKENFEFYGQFSASLIPEIDEYIYKKSYMSETVDLIINILSNAYGVAITVIRVGPSGKVSLLRQDPRNASSPSRRIFLYQTGEGNGTHYDAITDDCMRVGELTINAYVKDNGDTIKPCVRRVGGTDGASVAPGDY